MKNKIFLLCMIIVLCLSACADNETKTYTYTYEEVSSQQQAIVDGVYEQYASWKYVRDSGDTIPVTNVNFLYEDDVLLFVTYYDEGNDGVGYFYSIREVGQNGDLTNHVYENKLFDEKERTKERNAMMAGVCGFAYPLNEGEQKDVLANALYNAQENK